MRIRAFILKTALLATAFAGAASVASATAYGGYTFSEDTATYTAITGGTVHSTVGWDDNTSAAHAARQNPGFTITFGGTTFTRFVIQRNGCIILTNVAGTIPGTGINLYAPLSSAAPANGVAYDNVIAPMGGDCFGDNAGSEIRWQTLGVSPTRTLVVQWTNVHPYPNGGTANTASMDFQIRISEALTNGNSVIQFHYGNVTGLVGDGQPFEVGIKRVHASNNVNNRSITDSGRWTATHHGVYTGSPMVWAQGINPVSNQRFTYTAISATTTPTNVIDVLPSSAVEGSAINVVFEAFLGPVTANTTFNWQLFPGSATAGVDYTGPTTGSATILNGLTQTSISIPTANNATRDIKTFVCRITGFTSAPAGTGMGQDSALMRILNDTSEPFVGPKMFCVDINQPPTRSISEWTAYNTAGFARNVVLNMFDETIFSTGLAFAGNDQTRVYFQDFVNDMLYYMDTNTYGITPVGSMALVTATEFITSMAWDNLSSRMFVMGSDTTTNTHNIYTTSTVSGGLTLITSISGAGSNVGGLAIHPVTGDMYVFDCDAATDRLLRLTRSGVAPFNPTGAFTVVGALGTNFVNVGLNATPAFFGGAATFDRTTNTLYLMCIDDQWNAASQVLSVPYGTVNTTTGAFTLIRDVYATPIRVLQSTGIAVGGLAAGVDDWFLQ